MELKFQVCKSWFLDLILLVKFGLILVVFVSKKCCYGLFFFEGLKLGLVELKFKVCKRWFLDMFLLVKFDWFFVGWLNQELRKRNVDMGCLFVPGDFGSYGVKIWSL